MEFGGEAMGAIAAMVTTPLLLVVGENDETRSEETAALSAANPKEVWRSFARRAHGRPAGLHTQLGGTLPRHDGLDIDR